MTIGQNSEAFYQLPVHDFKSAEDWQGVNVAYRLRTDWDGSPNDVVEMLDTLAEHEDAPELTALVIGMWGTESDVSSKDAIKALVRHKDRLSGLRAIFVGDITYEENEMSWIHNSDVSPLFGAFPRLELLRVRGGNDLKFSKPSHPELRELIVETGGLPRSVLKEISGGDFPNLEHLELWLGTEGYGWDGSVKDLHTILQGKLFPKLKYLGLRNCAIADEVVPAVVKAPVVRTVEVLDLSGGTLSDVGASSLLDLPKNIPLRELILNHHYMTHDMVEKLKKGLGCDIRVDEGHDPEEEWRSIMVSE